MNDKHQAESIRTKVIFLVADKLILAGIIVLAGFCLNSILARQKSVSDYQKNIFDRRVETYVAILEKARIAHDKIVVFLGTDNPSRSVKFQEIHDQAMRILTPPIGVGVSYWTSVYRISPKEYDEAIKPLEIIDSIMIDRSLYISEVMKKKVNRFIDTLLSDLKISLMFDQMVRKDGVRITVTNEQLEKAEEFARIAKIRQDALYDDLEKTIRELLKIDGIVIG